MRLCHASFLCLCLAGVLAGCRSPGSGAKAAAPGLGEAGAPLPVPPSGKLTNLAANAFNGLDTTNQILPEWLSPPTNFFRIGPGDTVAIESFGDATAGATVTVGPDGKIYYSLLPGLFVWGLTLTETKDFLEKELSKFTRVKPEMSVSLKAVGSKRFWMLGSVSSPGVYSLATPTTLLEAMTLAGGPMLAAGAASGMPDLQKSFVMRNGKSLPIDFNRLLASGDLSQNIYLQPDDFVYLRATTTPDVFVMGAVRGPRALPYSDHLSVLSAIAAAGGTVEYAQVSHVAVVRGSLTSPRIALVDYRAITQGKGLDVHLEPGDIVYVPFVFYRKLAILAESMIRQFVLQIASNEAYNLVVPNAIPVAPGVQVPPPVNQGAR